MDACHDLGVLDLAKFNNLSLRYSSKDFQLSVFQALEAVDDFGNLRMIRAAKFWRHCNLRASKT